MRRGCPLFRSRGLLLAFLTGRRLLKLAGLFPASRRWRRFGTLLLRSLRLSLLRLLRRALLWLLPRLLFKLSRLLPTSRGRCHAIRLLVPLRLVRLLRLLKLPLLLTPGRRRCLAIIGLFVQTLLPILLFVVETLLFRLISSGRSVGAFACLAHHLINWSRSELASRGPLNRVDARTSIGKYGLSVAIKIHRLTTEILNHPCLIDDSGVINDQVPRAEMTTEAADSSKYKERRP